VLALTIASQRKKKPVLSGVVTGGNANRSCSLFALDRGASLREKDFLKSTPHGIEFHLRD
jgi:hypothetical protein